MLHSGPTVLPIGKPKFYVSSSYTWLMSFVFFPHNILTGSHPWMDKQGLLGQFNELIHSLCKVSDAEYRLNTDDAQTFITSYNYHLTCIFLYDQVPFPLFIVLCCCHLLGPSSNPDQFIPQSQSIHPGLLRQRNQFEDYRGCIREESWMCEHPWDMSVISGTEGTLSHYPSHTYQQSDSFALGLQMGQARAVVAEWQMYSTFAFGLHREMYDNSDRIGLCTTSSLEVFTWIGSK